jgi:hypothetical protein
MIGWPRKAKGGEMKHQMYKGLTMMSLMVAVTLAVAVGSTNAQSRRVTATVPFEFVVGDKTFAAGDYEVRSVTDGGQAMMIRNEDSQLSITRLTNTLHPKKTNSTPRLVFHRYGADYFLAEIWSGGDYTGRQVLESKRERSLRKEMKALAQNQYERVELVAVVR